MCFNRICNVIVLNLGVGHINVAQEVFWIWPLPGRFFLTLASFAKRGWRFSKEQALSPFCLSKSQFFNSFVSHFVINRKKIGITFNTLEISLVVSPSLLGTFSNSHITVLHNKGSFLPGSTNVLLSFL